MWTRQGTTKAADEQAPINGYCGNTYPSRHQAQTSQPASDTEGTLSSELDSDETERLISRRNQSKVGTTKQVRRQCSEFGFGVHPFRMELHETGELFRGESTVKINNRANADELNGGLLVQTANP